METPDTTFTHTTSAVTDLPVTEKQVTVAPFHPLSSRMFLAGCAMLVFNMVSWLFSQNNTSFESLWGCTMLAHTVNMFYLLALGIWQFRKALPVGWTACATLWLTACMFNCFAINADVPIFAPFSTWVNILIGALAVTSVLYAWRDQLPVRMMQGILFVFSMALCLCMYLATYLVQFYHIGILGLTALGLGVYIFIPLFYSISLIMRLGANWSACRNSILAGLLLPVCIAVFFSIQWKNANHTIKNAPVTSELPKWVAVAQQLQPNWINWRVLGSGIFFQEPKIGFGFADIPANARFAEVTRHDPFIFIANLFSPADYALEQEDKIRILHTVFGNDHATEERLWSGTHLSTAQLSTAVHLQPATRIATTEMTLEVANTQQQNEGRWLPPTQEAIYTFHLPDGAVVTDLSLWINGVEEKGHLTTRARADKAYKTIVGQERRDPSLLHWKEGSTISVRVFPCTPLENRRFKIGFISPLQTEGQQLVYERAWLEGPPTAFYPQPITVTGVPRQAMLETPCTFEGTDTLSGVVTGRSSWRISMQTPALSNTTVQVGNQLYTTVPLQTAAIPFAPTGIYLDLNTAWQENEYAQVLQAAANTPVYVAQGIGWQRVTADNKDRIFELAAGLNFSLFSFHHIPAGGTPLLITKSNAIGPRFSDLQPSGFATNFVAFDRPLPVLSIGAIRSPYLLMLKDLGMIQVTATDIAAIAQHLQKGTFPAPDLRAGELPLAIAGIKLTPNTGSTPATTDGYAAPISKLIGYQTLLRTIGHQYLKIPDDPTIQEQWIDQARQIGVVTPVSSLVVLETQQDYERFNIDKKGGALNGDELAQLAQTQTGSAPEPREWALLITALTLMLIFIRWKW